MEVLKMYDVDKIANWFIWYNEYIRDFENEDTDDITNMKLQKLLFYAYWFNTRHTILIRLRTTSFSAAQAI